MSGFGADAPTDNTHKKHGVAVLFIIVIICWNCVRGPCFKGLFVKSPLKIRKNFPPNISLHFSEAFEFPKDFFRKVLCVRVWGRCPNIQCTQKSTALPCFYFLPQIFRILPVCLYLTYKFAERFGVRHVRHALPNGIRRYDLNIAFISVYKCLYGVWNKKLAF